MELLQAIQYLESSLAMSACLVIVSVCWSVSDCVRYAGILRRLIVQYLESPSKSINRPNTNFMQTIITRDTRLLLQKSFGLYVGSPQSQLYFANVVDDHADPLSLNRHDPRDILTASGRTQIVLEDMHSMQSIANAFSSQ